MRVLTLPLQVSKAEAGVVRFRENRGSTSPEQAKSIVAGNRVPRIVGSVRAEISVTRFSGGNENIAAK